MSLSSLSAREQREDTDSELMQTVTNLKNRLLHRIRLNANNVLTFAKASPMVQIVDGEAVPIATDTRNDFDLRKEVLGKLEATGMQF